jgi:threonine dehydrogenase-like Zn-dependent dehydrogenase
LKAIAIVPGRPETAGVIDLPEPAASDGSLLVRTLLIGMCGTDREMPKRATASRRRTKNGSY